MPVILARGFSRCSESLSGRLYSGHNKHLKTSEKAARRSRASSSKHESYQQTLDWARSLLKSKLAADQADSSIQLGHLSLLIAIEDAAAAEIYFQGNDELFLQAILRKYWGLSQEDKTEVDEEYDLSAVSEAPILGELGTASTWSLNRLDTLAQEVEAEFRNNLLDGSQQANDADETEESQGTDPKWDCREAARKYPMLAISAVNEVLFEQHGYQGIPPNKDPRQHQLPHVLEQGGGSPAVLTILYLEVCARIGLPMKAALVEEGRYTVLWPEDVPLKACGEEVVIDVFSKGCLFLLSEIRQLFDLGPEPLTPATNREIICALLGGLRDVHWCKAIGGRADKVDFVPLSIDNVMEGVCPKRQGYQMERAIAAAERCCWALPDDRNYKAILAVLLYSADKHAQALKALANEHGDEDIRMFKFMLRTLNKALKRNLIEL